jgi:GTP-binding protein
MKIKESRFITSSSGIEQCPSPQKAEFAFIGRSNVGKSSLINMLTDRRNLAKISSKPGKTQLINHFEIDQTWYLVDLPGYGWSKVSKQKKVEWGKMIEEYLLNRENLVCLFVLIDSRLDPQTIDYEFISWLGEKEIPFSIVFTKTDKQSKIKFQSTKARHIRKLKSRWEEIPLIFESSSVDKTGQKEILEFAGELISDFKP